jgi:DNA-binding transcriptional regulator YiaG
MTRTPGRRTDEPAEGEELATEGMTYGEVGLQLSELARQLAAVAAHIDDPKFFRDADEASALGSDRDREDVERELETRLQRTLLGMQSFRRNYDYWERAIAEYALKNGMTQRTAARLLGVSTATINRWAQHPVSTPE